MTAERAWIGMDPGIRGMLDDSPRSGQPTVANFASYAKEASEVLRWWLLGCDIKFVAIEVAASRPEQCFRSVFTFGRSFGEWLGILTAFDSAHVLAMPMQREHQVLRSPDSPKPAIQSFKVARCLFSDTSVGSKKGHRSSDALLLAHWAKQGGRR